MASQLRVNKSENRSGLGTITYTDTGAIVSGIVTANSFSGDIIGNITGAVTATTGSFSGDVSIAEKIIHTGDTNTFMKFDTDTVTFETAGDQRIRIDSVGDIFIGTTSDIAPANGTNLCVSDATISRLILEKQSTIKFGLNVSNGFTIYDETNDASRFGIGSVGEIQIGTTSWPTGTMAKAAGRVLVGGGGDLTLWNETNSAGGVASFKLACKEGGDASKISYVQFFGGAENTSDQKGFLKVNVSDANGGGQERLRIDSSGNIGQSVTPSGWASAQAGDFYAYQIGTGMAIFGRGSGDEDRGGISCNYYNTASAQKYIGNGHAGRIYFEDGNILFSNAAQNGAGAGAAMTLDERLKITSDGNFGTNGVTPTTQAGKVFHLHAGAAQQRFHMTNATTGSGATDGFEIIVEESANTRIRNFEAGDMAFDTGGSNNEAMRITSSGQLLVGTTSSSERFHLLKSHNGHTRAVIQNNWGSNATAQLKLISPTDELQLIKYASGAAAINLSNNSTMYMSIGGQERLKIRGDSTSQTTHIVNTPSPGGNGVDSQYVTQVYAMSGNYTNFRVTVTASSWHSFFLKMYVSGYNGHSAYRWVTGYCNNGFGTIRHVHSYDGGNFGSGSITHISGQSWRYDLSMNSGAATHPVMHVELSVGGNGNVRGNGAVVCAIT